MKFVTQSYYEILDVPPDAGDEQIRRAYRQARQTFQPDSMAIYSLYAPEESEAIAAKIDEAFQILTDRERRRRYDRYLDFRRQGEPVPDEPDGFYDRVRDLYRGGASQGLAGALSGFASRGAAAFAGADPGLRTRAEREAPAGRRPPVEAAPSGAAERRAPEPVVSAAARAIFGEDDPLYNDGGEPLAARAEPPSPWEAREATAEAARARGAAQGEETPRGEDGEARSGRGGSVLSGWTRESVARLRGLAHAPPEPLALRAISPEVLRSLEEELGTSGAYLQRVRELRGIDLQTISERTKISLLYLKFIEEENFADLPAPIYLRGFLQQLARLLELPEQRLVDGYMARYRKARG